MVRKPEPGGESNEDHTENKEENTDSDGGSNDVGRRSVLKLAGVAATAGVAGTGLIDMANAATDYDTITLDSGEMRQVTLGDGDTFANKLIDQRADGAAFSIKATGNNWTIKNVGFLGGGERDRFNFHMRVACPNGGTGLIENIYANNKEDPTDPMGMAWEQPDHVGHITMRHTYIEGMGNNAGYFTNANKRDRAGGTVTFEKCYHVDNTPSNYRLGGDGSLVKDCVSVVNDPEPQDRANYPDGSSNKCRPVWAAHTDGIRLENVQYYTNPDDVNPGSYFDLRHGDISDGSVCEVTAVDCAGNLSEGHELFENFWGGNENLIVQNYQQGQQTVTVLGSGVPLSAEMAARGERALPTELPGSDGGSSGDSGSSLDRTLTIDGTDADRTDYTFTVSEDIENNPEVGSFGDGDTIDGSTASGFVNGGTDGYLFSGEISDATVNGNATILVDGQEVTFDDGNDSGSSLDRTLTIDGTDADRTDYTFTVSEDIENNPEVGSFGDGDTIDGSTASGFVNGGTDGYLFSGEISDATVDGNATVLVDGQETEFLPSLPNKIVIDGTQDAGESTYSFAVSGDLQTDPEDGQPTRIDSSSTSGTVADSQARFQFSGDIVQFQLDGTADVTLEDNDG